MILYFDNYITDQPFYSGGHQFLGEVRNSKAEIYKMPSKLDITLYTLASYAEINWSKVIIKYELENISQKKEFETRLKKLFPSSKLKIIYGRSDRQRKFQETINFMDSIPDDWIFYAGNNDHPFLSPNKDMLDACLNEAKEIAKKDYRVSIAISHFTEFYNKARKGSPFHEVNYSDSKIINENEKTIISFFPKGMYHSMQIVNKRLFKHWFFSGNAGETLVRRSECMFPFMKKIHQFVVIPKKELCAHFDGEIHTNKTAYNLSYDLCPPLFIPFGFFENKIKIRFGYEDYKKGWVNINPAKEKYSFRDLENGTDLKISFEQIPLFWKRRIKQIDKNPDLNEGEIKIALIKREYFLRNPFPKKSRIYYYFYRQKSNFFSFLHKISFIRKPIKKLMKKSKKFNKIYEKSVNIKFKG